MENIKKNLTEAYNSSVIFFNSGDYKHFFDDARNTIEWLSKYMIHEILSSSTLADDIILGRNTIKFDKSTNLWYPVGQRASEEPKGAYLSVILKHCIYYKYPQIWNPEKIQKMQKLKTAVESDLGLLANFYNAASEMALHTGGSQLDMLTQAKGYVSFIAKFVDDIKSICGETRKLWGTFAKFDLTSVDFQYKSIEEELERLYLT